MHKIKKKKKKKYRTIGFLSHNLSSCPLGVTDMANKGFVQPILYYASPVWDPHGIVVQEELNKVQNHAARFLTGDNNIEIGSMISIIKHLG